MSASARARAYVASREHLATVGDGRAQPLWCSSASAASCTVLATSVSARLCIHHAAALQRGRAAWQHCRVSESISQSRSLHRSLAGCSARLRLRRALLHCCGPRARLKLADRVLHAIDRRMHHAAAYILGLGSHSRQELRNDLRCELGFARSSVQKCTHARTGLTSTRACSQARTSMRSCTNARQRVNRPDTRTRSVRPRARGHEGT